MVNVPPPQGESDTSAQPGYWYESLSDHHVEVLNLLRDYREAERKMRSHTRDDMRMNETELLALRYLLKQTNLNTPVLQRDIARELGITGASASALAQRLERDGYIERNPHPKDGRATVLVPTVKTNEEVRSTLNEMHQQMFDVVRQLDDREVLAVKKFLIAMIETVKNH